MPLNASLGLLGSRERIAAGPFGGEMCGLRRGDSERSRSVFGGAFFAAASRPS